MGGGQYRWQCRGGPMWLGLMEAGANGGTWLMCPWLKEDRGQYSGVDGGGVNRGGVEIW